MTTIAEHLLRALRAATGTELPVRLHAWDGSRAGPADGVIVELRSPDAIGHLVRRPGEQGLARAYVTGALDAPGGLRAALATVGAALRHHSRPRRRPLTPLSLARAAREVAATGALGSVPSRPPEEARPRGRRHSLDRDRQAVRHHYDAGNEIYRLILDETMSYSCGYWAPEAMRAASLEPGTDQGTAASLAKLDLVCRKLGLRPGGRLVDIGCGWGSLLLHAARRYKVYATGYTISEEQAAYVRKVVAREGLADLVDVEVRDYREVNVTGADAVASIEMGEHVGDRQYPGYAATLLRCVRPGGRLVLQQMSRGYTAPGGGAFIESYIAPDMHMRPVADTLAVLQGAGFEIRDVEAMREHYVRTVDAWASRLEERWTDMAALAGERTARIWRLYLAGGGLAFDENRMGVDQIMAVRPYPDGRNRMPLARPWTDIA